MVLRKNEPVRLLGKKVILRPKTLADAAIDYTWATDRELMRLDAGEPCPFDYSEYLAGYPHGLTAPNRIQLAIESPEGEHIGNCTCYNIDEYLKEAEMGIMIGRRDYWGKGYGTDAMQTLISYVFEEFELERVYLHTLEWNSRACKCFERCGFAERGRLMRQEQRFIKMEFLREQA